MSKIEGRSRCARVRPVGRERSRRGRGVEGVCARRRFAARLVYSLVLVASLVFGGCFRREEGEQFYGKVTVPALQEFRWSDGGLPKVFDPARAAAPPDTDAVRALFEGLTDYEPGSLRPVPAVASRWETSDDGGVWTFHLRPEARWSNGDPVTAQDFVRSWQRTLRLGERAPHARLLANIEGARLLGAPFQTPAPGAAFDEAERGGRAGAKSASPTPTPQQFGVVALDARTLRVTLQRPDKNFPALVAHPVFRPVHELNPGVDLPELRGEQAQGGGSSDETAIITNGAFGLAQLAGDSVELRRAESYWDATSVKLERVLFVDKSDADGALAAYRAGDVDAVTNASVEPLAVKLLTPYRDFRRGTFAALNYYDFNTARPPFDDRRVREALACALDTVRLSADTLGGATEPADRFLPVPPGGDGGDGDSDSAAKGGPEKDGGAVKPLRHDVARARALLADAGYPGGQNFPHIQLIVNRNEQQRAVAQAVARMWRDALGVETDVVVRPWEEYEAMLRAGDYDVARRSIVMQTTDEESNMIELFGDEPPSAELAGTPGATPQQSPASTQSNTGALAERSGATRRGSPVLTEAQALNELPAIPLHFASSYALVKPYVEGFESNLLDAPSLKNVRINTGWQQPVQSQATLTRR
ncbi:MAG TPA: peptide ABC transporter substrate-binding protein [Pyrinomonadaceae bacterium]|nr:peptide ABC transporter substrate-binding protein [Pyrinomonadaceae bacterium]